MAGGWIELALIALASVGIAAGCGPGSGMDAGSDAAPDALELDGGAMDGALDDAAAGPDADAPSDDGGGVPEGDADAPADTPELDACAACPTPSNPCEVAVGCGAACSIEVLPDETACGPDGARCLAGVCTPLSCGDGVRETMPREACDDGNDAAGDLCSPSCAPTLHVVAAPPGEEAFAPALAEDPSGNVLVVWVEARPATATRERTLIVRGARYSALGVRFLGDPFTIDSGTGDAGFGIGQAITPVVAGRTGGWVVAWRSTFIEGTDADLGGIAFRAVSNTGAALGTLRQANVEERFDQREPAIASLDGGASFVIAWTDGSDRSRDPGLGVRARVFSAAGAATSAELVVATDTTGDQSQPALSSGAGDTWSVAFTDASSGMPLVRLRRYAGATPSDAAPLDLTAGWSSAPRLSPQDGSSLHAAWLDRSDAAGDIGVSVTPIGMPPGDVSLFGTDGVRDDGGVIASRTGRATVGWRTDEAPQGLRLVPIDWTPPELDELDPLLAGGRQHDLRLLPTATGLWLTWTDESIPDATSAVVAYLLPWD
jgi:cysteine-rich repeat protein